MLDNMERSYDATDGYLGPGAMAPGERYELIRDVYYGKTAKGVVYAISPSACDTYTLDQARVAFGDARLAPQDYVLQFDHPRTAANGFAIPFYPLIQPDRPADALPADAAGILPAGTTLRVARITNFTRGENSWTKYSAQFENGPLGGTTADITGLTNIDSGYGVSHGYGVNPFLIRRVE